MTRWILLLALARAPMPVPWNVAARPAEPFAYGFVDSPPLTVADGDVAVRTETPPLPGDGAYAYTRVWLENKTRKPQPVELSYQSNQGERVSRSLELAGGERRTVVLPIPSGMLSGVFEARGPGIGASNRHSMYLNRATPYFILVVGSRSEFEAALHEPADTSGRPSVSVMCIEPSDLSDELAPYVGFDQVLLLDTAWRELPVAVRAALEAYAATGGMLLLGKPERELQASLPLLSADPASDAYGFGRVLPCPDGCGAALKDSYAPAAMVVRRRGPTPSWARRYGRFAPSAPDSELSLLPEAMAPVGWFLLIILAFSLAVGPGSIWVARRKGPVSVLLFIPLTALGTCLGLAGYSVLHDGFTLHAASRSYTLLDRANGRAITVGLGAFYANLAPPGATFDTHSAVVFPGEQAPQGASVDWTHGARFDASFLPSRTYREWGMLSVAPSRARLVVRKEGDRVQVKNALGGGVTGIQLVLDGRSFAVGRLENGAEAPAREVTADPLVASPLREFETRFDPDLHTQFRRPLANGEFLAYLEGTGPLPLGGLRISDSGSVAGVRGRVDGP